MKTSKAVILFPFYITIFIMSLFADFPAEGADKENCLMCHKYRFLGRIDENGKKINYNVSEHVYEKSMHRNVPCRDCHVNISKLPHEPVKEEVSCANECHIKPPFSDENFSHKKIIDTYNNSAHAIKDEDPDDLKQAKPYCKYCHFNPLFTEVEENRVSSAALQRCMNCHEEQGVTQAYKHITHRLRHKTSRAPYEIVNLCSKCHRDVELMKKFNVSKENLESVESYERSIHGKAIQLGSQKTADCVSCHATTAIHDIYKKDNPNSMVHESNLTKTCEQCHEKVNDEFIRIDVHSRIEREEKPVLYYMNFFLGLALYGTVFGLLALLILETYGRHKDGIKWQIRNGTTWRGKSKRKTGEQTPEGEDK